MQTKEQETQAVKQALKFGGLRWEYVRHGTGTAGWWLHIKLVPHPTMPADIMQHQALALIQANTSRRPFDRPYHDDINFF